MTTFISMQSDQDFKATGITLKQKDFKDFDKIVHIFTREYGLVQAIAKGIKKTNKNFTGNIDLLNISDFVIKKGKGLNNILQCENIKHFPLIRLDYDKLIYSLFLGELILLLTHDNDDNKSIFDLLVYTLEKIEKSEVPIVETIWFQINLLRIIGYEQDFFYCTTCDKEIVFEDKKLGFSLNTGGIICNSCIQYSFNYKIILEDTLKTIIQINNLEEDNKYSEETLNKIQSLFKEYFSILSEKKIKTLTTL